MRSSAQVLSAAITAEIGRHLHPFQVLAPKPTPAAESWWICEPEQFYQKARVELPRMVGGSGVGVVAYLRRQMGEEN